MCLNENWNQRIYRAVTKCSRYHTDIIKAKHFVCLLYFLHVKLTDIWNGDITVQENLKTIHYTLDLLIIL